jgi:hypothetical protein
MKSEIRFVCPRHRLHPGGMSSEIPCHPVSDRGTASEIRFIWHRPPAPPKGSGVRNSKATRSVGRGPTSEIRFILSSLSQGEWRPKIQSHSIYARGNNVPKFGLFALGTGSQGEWRPKIQSHSIHGGTASEIRFTCPRHRLPGEWRPKIQSHSGIHRQTALYNRFRRNLPWGNGVRNSVYLPSPAPRGMASENPKSLDPWGNGVRNSVYLPSPAPRGEWHPKIQSHSIHGGNGVRNSVYLPSPAPRGNGVRKSKVTRSMGERRPKFGLLALTGSQGNAVRKSRSANPWEAGRRPKFGLLALTGSPKGGTASKKSRSATPGRGERRPKFGFSALITGSTQGNGVRKSRLPDPWERDGVRNSVHLPL